MPKYKEAAPQPYDSRILSQDADTFTVSDPNDAHKSLTVPKDQGMGSMFSEGFSYNDKQTQKLNAVRKQMGWKVTVGDP